MNHSSGSWYTVVHSRDIKDTGVAYKVNVPKNQLQFSNMMMEQYWLGKTKLSDQPETFSISCYRLLKKNI